MPNLLKTALVRGRMEVKRELVIGRARSARGRWVESVGVHLPPTSRRPVRFCVLGGWVGTPRGITCRRKGEKRGGAGRTVEHYGVRHLSPPRVSAPLIVCSNVSLHSGTLLSCAPRDWTRPTKMPSLEASVSEACTSLANPISMHPRTLKSRNGRSLSRFPDLWTDRDRPRNSSHLAMKRATKRPVSPRLCAGVGDQGGQVSPEDP